MSCTHKYVLQLILYGLYYPLLYGSIVSYWKVYRKSMIGLTLTVLTAISPAMQPWTSLPVGAMLQTKRQSDRLATALNKFSRFALRNIIYTKCSTHLNPVSARVSRGLRCAGGPLPASSGSCPQTSGRFRHAQPSATGTPDAIEYPRETAGPVRRPLPKRRPAPRP